MLSTALSAAVDRVVAATLVRPSLRRVASTAPSRPPILAAGDPDTFFASSPPIKPELTRSRPLGSTGAVFDAAWPSGTPHDRDVTDAYLAHVANRSARARLFLHDAPARAAILLVHGYLGGRFAVEERAWPVRRWFAGGFDVALVTLPFHGARADVSFRAPRFPSSDARFTNEGVRQAIGDLRALHGWFFARGTSRVGAMGMSLGGYIVALLATLERELAFVVPVIPLADLTEFSRGELPRARFARSPGHEVISPLARAPSVSSERVLVVGAEADAIAPLSHARALADHFGAPLETFRGGHVLQVGRAVAFRRVDQLIERSHS